MAYIVFDDKYTQDYSHGIMQGHVYNVSDLDLEKEGQQYIKNRYFL